MLCLRTPLQLSSEVSLLYILQICSVDICHIKPCDSIISVFCFVHLFFCSVVGDSGISLLPTQKYNDYRKQRIS